MKILVLNGPNLNMLGMREPNIYGKTTYQELVNMIESYAKENNIVVSCVQSNHEGDLVDAIQTAWKTNLHGIVLNAGAYTHTSIALLDALKAVDIPAVEVHISNTQEREEFRKTSYIRQACVKTIEGKGLQGYLEAIDFLKTYRAK